MIRSQITEAGQLEDALAAEHFLLFKHSYRCSISTHAFQAYSAFVKAHPDIRHGWIDVVAHREWAREVARRTDVRHASPQILWLHQGHALWDQSHFDIKQETLEAHVRPAAS